jgi:hypothetical protein
MWISVIKKFDQKIDNPALQVKQEIRRDAE